MPHFKRRIVPERDRDPWVPTNELDLYPPTWVGPWQNRMDDSGILAALPLILVE